MKKVFYLFDRDSCSLSFWAKEELEKIFAGDGRFSFEAGNEIETSLKKYDAVIVFKKLSRKEKEMLDEYRVNGKGVVFINMCCESGLTDATSIENMGVQQFTVFIEDTNHYLSQRFPAEFQITDYLFNVSLNNAETVFYTLIKNKKVPVVAVKENEKGRVCWVFAGNTKQTWKEFNFRKIIVRCVAWSTGEKIKDKTINCGLVGYGPMFGMGKGHGSHINSTKGMKTIAVCDTNPARVEAAKQELGGLAGYFTNLEEMLKMKELDLIVGIVPHDVHFDVAMKAFEYGKHVIMEKPFCINVEQATKMIDAARKSNLMLSVFHNRRWDGDYVVIKNLVESGLIGDVFHIECFIGFYDHPRYWWRSEKRISGGVMHDWGAHFWYWILDLVPSKINCIFGDFQKRVWFSVTNEDHGRAIVRFENGVVADFTISSIAAIPKPQWKILGTLGAIEKNSAAPDRINFVSFVSGTRQEGSVKVHQSTGWVEYYRNIADHLLMGEELIVKPEQARRVIGVIEAAEKSSKLNKSIEPFEDCQ